VIEPSEEQRTLKDDETVTLWTLMPLAAWEALVRDGRLGGDGRRADRWLREHYRWMMDQMRIRIPGFRGGFPVWAWYRPKPDLRRRNSMDSRGAMMRIEYRVAPGMVLLSDFSGWHSILNQHYLSLTEHEADEWDQLARDATGMQYPRISGLPPDLQDRVHESWERIFDLELLATSAWMNGNGEEIHEQAIQAVLEEIRLEWVVKVTPFTTTPMRERRLRAG
jgi:hypothetical protein